MSCSTKGWIFSCAAAELLTSNSGFTCSESLKGGSVKALQDERFPFALQNSRQCSWSLAVLFVLLTKVAFSCMFPLAPAFSEWLWKN